MDCLVVVTDEDMLGLIFGNWLAGWGVDLAVVVDG